MLQFRVTLRDPREVIRDFDARRKSFDPLELCLLGLGGSMSSKRLPRGDTWLRTCGETLKMKSEHFHMMLLLHEWDGIHLFRAGRLFWAKLSQHFC